MFDADAQIQKIFPWNFPVLYGGHQYQTRAPTLGDLAGFQELQGAGAPLHQYRAAMELLRSLFVGEAPPLEKWPMPLMFKLVFDLFAHSAELQKKTLPALGLGKNSEAESPEK